MHKRGLSRRTVSMCLSVGPSVYLSRLYILSKRIIVPLNFFHRRVLHHSSFTVPNVMAIFRRGHPNRGVECRYGRQKSRFSAYIWLYIGSMDRWLLQCEQQLRPSTVQFLSPKTQHRPRFDQNKIQSKQITVSVNRIYVQTPNSRMAKFVTMTLIRWKINSRS